MLQCRFPKFFGTKQSLRPYLVPFFVMYHFRFYMIIIVLTILQINCAINFYFRLYLILYACAAKFDTTKNLKNLLVFEVN